jgi:F-type H+-transporting ATPase subunit b
MHFDWSTLVLQTVNVLVLLWLLRRFLFRPVAAIVAARKEAAEKVLADAAAAREQAQAQAALASQHETALAADSAGLLAEARAAAQTERAALMEQSKTEAARILDAAQADLGKQRGQMRRDLEVEARRLAVSIASRLLGRVPAQAVSAALVEALRALPAEEWHPLEGLGEALEVVTAAPLDAVAQAACVDLVRQRLGCDVRFGTDPSLIAGVDLRGPHARLHNNWRADLDRIAEELRQDDKYPVMA